MLRARRCWPPRSPAAARRCADGSDASDLVPGLLQVEPGAARRGLAGQRRLRAVRGSAGCWSPGSPPPSGAGSTRRPRSPPPLGHLQWRDARPSDAGWAAHDGPQWRVREVVEQLAGQPAGHRPRAERARRGLHAAGSSTTSPHGPDSLPFTLTVTRREPDSRIVMDVQRARRGRRGDARATAATAGPCAAPAPRVAQPCCATAGTRSSAAAPACRTRPVPRSRRCPCCCPARPTASRVDGTGYSHARPAPPGRVDTTVWQPRPVRPAVRRHPGPDGQPARQRRRPDAPAAGLGDVRRRSCRCAVRPSGCWTPRSACWTPTPCSPPCSWQDGGQRARYPHWHEMVDRLSAKDVRVLTSVSPSLALEPRRVRSGRRVRRCWPPPAAAATWSPMPAGGRCGSRCRTRTPARCPAC